MKKKILIVEDNEDFAYNILKSIEENIDNIDVIEIASNGIEAINNIKKLEPDIVLLDLNIPKINGLYIIELLDKLKINIIVMTGDIQLLNDLEIMYFNNIKQIYIKPFDLKKLCNDIQYLCTEIEDEDISDLINYELSKFKFNKGSVAYKYLIDTIKFSYQYPDKIRNMEKELFPLVAKNNNIESAIQIKWALQKLISSMSRYTNKETLKEYFSYDLKPSVKTFVITINEQIVLKCKEKSICKIG